MQQTIHPRYDLTTVTCTTCGTEHALRSTRGAHTVDVCADCHPFFTGAERKAPTGGRIARFEQRRARAVAAVR